jgi:hypothetical protein
MYLNLHKSLAGTGSTIFALVLGFTLFMLNQSDKRVDPTSAVLLGLGIFGSLLTTATSTIAVLFGSEKVMWMNTIYISTFFLFTSFVALGILTALALSQLYTDKVKEDHSGSGKWDFMRLK